MAQVYIDYKYENARVRIPNDGSNEAYVRLDNNPEFKATPESKLVTDAILEGKRITEKEYLADRVDKKTERE